MKDAEVDWGVIPRAAVSAERGAPSTVNLIISFYLIRALRAQKERLRYCFEYFSSPLCAHFLSALDAVFIKSNRSSYFLVFPARISVN